MMEEICDAYEVKRILGYRREKTYAAATKETRENKPGLDKEKVWAQIEISRGDKDKTSPQQKKEMLGLGTPSLDLGKKGRKRSIFIHSLQSFTNTYPHLNHKKE